MFLIVTNAVVPKYYNRKPPIGQPLFSHFCNWVSGCKFPVQQIKTYLLLPPSAVPHISHPPVPKSRGMTAEGELPRRGKRGHPGVSPRGEKPCPSSNVVRSIVTGTRFLQRLLPRGRSCQKKCFMALFLTDVGVAAPCWGGIQCRNGPTMKKHPTPKRRVHVDLLGT